MAKLVIAPPLCDAWRRLKELKHVPMKFDALSAVIAGLVPRLTGLDLVDKAHGVEPSVY
jgi:hypothetical protein